MNDRKLYCVSIQKDQKLGGCIAFYRTLGTRNYTEYCQAILSDPSL